jgi:hypothetical protein
MTLPEQKNQKNQTKQTKQKKKKKKKERLGLLVGGGRLQAQARLNMLHA